MGDGIFEMSWNKKKRAGMPALRFDSIYNPFDQ